MGLETDGKQGLGDKPVDQGSSTPLEVLRRGLTSKGWTDTDFGFSLARQTGAIDVTKDDRRVLYYTAEPEDYKGYILLTQHELPVFHTTMLPVTTGLSSIELPQTARALDSMKFPDQGPQGAYLGSFEIMDEIAKLLARIYKMTGTMPQDMSLGRFAMFPGDEDIIRLIPPLKFVRSTNWEKTLEPLFEDLKKQDPDHEHKLQTEHLKEAFRHFLEDEKR